MEAFFDGVVAIIITIMVLEMKVPRGESIEALSPLLPVLSSYVLSFVYLGIYWNNHHHMMHACHRATGSMLWANLHLLFWLSLIPFTTGWMGENHFAKLPAAAYGFVLLMSAIAYLLLQQRIIASQGRGLCPAKGHRQRLERQALFGSLCCRYHPGVSVIVDSGRDLRLRRAHVGRSRQTNRTHPHWKGNITSPCGCT